MNKKFLWLVAALIVIVAGAASFTYYLLSARVPNCDKAQGRMIFVDRDDTADSVKAKSELGWRWNLYSKVLSFRPRTGRYRVEPGTTCLQLFRHLRNGSQ